MSIPTDARLARLRKQDLADAAQERRLSTCESRDIETIDAGSWTPESVEQHVEWIAGECVLVRQQLGKVYRGEQLDWDGSGQPSYRVRVISAEIGAHHSFRGGSGYYVSYTIELPPELRQASRIELVE